MTAGPYHPTIEQGATFTRVITWTDSDGNLVDLTDYTARASFRDKVGGTEVISLTTENGGISLGGAAGTIALNISATDTAALTAPQYGVWSLELVNGATVTRLLEGRFDVSPEVAT